MLSMITPCKVCQPGRDAVVNGVRVCSVCVPGMFVHKSTDSCTPAQRASTPMISRQRHVFCAS